MEDPRGLLQEELADDGWVEAEAWEQRPLPAALVEYAAGHGVVLPLLLKHFAHHERLTEARKAAVAEETVKRVRGSQAAVLVRSDNVAPQG